MSSKHHEEFSNLADTSPLHQAAFSPTDSHPISGAPANRGFKIARNCAMHKSI